MLNNDIFTTTEKVITTKEFNNDLFGKYIYTIDQSAYQIINISFALILDVKDNVLTVAMYRSSTRESFVIEGSKIYFSYYETTEIELSDIDKNRYKLFKGEAKDVEGMLREIYEDEMNGN